MGDKNQTLIAVTKADTIWLAILFLAVFFTWQIVDVRKDIDRLEDESMEYAKYIKPLVCKGDE